MARTLLYLALAALYLLHTDLWWWHDPRLVLGLPVGLAYHVAYCGAASGLMALVVRYAWPRHLDDPEAEGGGP